MRYSMRPPWTKLWSQISYLENGIRYGKKGVTMLCSIIDIEQKTPVNIDAKIGRFKTQICQLANS